jgi:hypothetical protein
MTTKAIGIVADLRVADLLTDGPRRVGELAAAIGADEDALYRFLRALASDGVFTEESPRTFANTPMSELLLSDRTDSWRDISGLFGDLWYRTFVDAEESLRSGEPVFPRQFGSDFWAWLEHHPEEGASFNRAMASGADQGIDRLVELDWREGETVVDVGGGNGAVLVALLRRRPELSGVVFDLPETAREAEELVAESGLDGRCRVVAGSFFDGVPSGGTYLLSAILHDWDDQHAARILGAIRSSAPPAARVVVRDAVIPPGDEPHGNKWLDLLMLVLIRGRERTEQEWRALLDASGFDVVSISDGLIVARCS